MIDCGAIPTIVLSMQQFPNEPKVQAAGCSMLPFLAREVDKVAISIVMNGGRQIIESAKTQHVNDGDVQQFTFELLECIDGADNADRCHNCHTTSGDVRKRSRCKKVVYCIRECQ